MLFKIIFICSMGFGLLVACGEKVRYNLETIVGEKIIVNQQELLLQAFDRSIVLMSKEIKISYLGGHPHFDTSKLKTSDLYLFAEDLKENKIMQSEDKQKKIMRMSPKTEQASLSLFRVEIKRIDNNEKSKSLFEINHELWNAVVLDSSNYLLMTNNHSIDLLLVLLEDDSSADHLAKTILRAKPKVVCLFGYQLKDGTDPKFVKRFRETIMLDVNINVISMVKENGN